DDDGAFLQRGEDAVRRGEDVLDVRGVGEHGDDDRGGAGDLGRRAGRRCPGGDELIHLSAAPVVDGQLMTGLDQMSRHWLAHHPEPNKPNMFSHGMSFRRTHVVPRTTHLAPRYEGYNPNARLSMKR